MDGATYTYETDKDGEALVRFARCGVYASYISIVIVENCLHKLNRIVRTLNIV